MEEQNPKHKIMARIAIFAGSISWVALIFYILWSLLVFPETFNQATQQAFTSMRQLPQNYLDLFRDFDTAVGLVLEVANRVVQGVGWFLILQAVSVGLNMLIEIDLNYKLLKEEAENE